MMGLHPFVLLSFVLGGTVFMTHRENLRRLRAGTEWKWRRRNPGRRDQS
jgi:glycerol-3-phosphate acyltransferase PlsY